MSDEYNCPPVCPECQRAHRGPCPTDDRSVPPGASSCVPCWVVMVKPILGSGRIANRVPIAAYTREEDAQARAKKVGGYAEEVPLYLPPTKQMSRTGSPKNSNPMNTNTPIESPVTAARVGSSPLLGSVLPVVEAADAKISAQAGYTTNPLRDWLKVLELNGWVEVGWRECCGTRHVTAKIRAEWLKVVKKLERSGVRLTVERVKHKNAYATTNGGFWNSEIFRLPNIAGLPRAGNAATPTLSTQSNP